MPQSALADTRAAYIAAGSSVGSLIERYGLDRFKNLLRHMIEEPFGPIYAEVYGKSLEVLCDEWRARIA